MVDLKRPARLRIVTINTAKSDSPYPRRLELLAQGLRLLDPDVVLLQEAFVAQDGTANTAADLGCVLEMAVAYAPARAKTRPFEGRTVLSESGMAVLTRGPAAECLAVPLPSAPQDGERIAQVCRIEVEGRPVLIANVHLCYLPGQDQLRNAELGSLLAHPLLQQDAAARIIAGDFNTALSGLPSLLQGLGRWEIQDCYQLGGGGMPRATCPTSLPAEQSRCIDFILSAVRAGEQHPAFEQSRVVLGLPGVDGVYPSDHRGVMTTLVLDEATQ